MKPEDIVRSGPNQYISKEGILNDLDYYLRDFHSPVVITGEKSYQAFLDYGSLPSTIKVIHHHGYCSTNAVNELAKQAARADVIVGIGGGIILDTAKSVAAKLDIDYMMIPTIVGTCAASAPLSVMYDDKGAFVGIDYHKRSSFLTILDPCLLVRSPINYFKSGIADTLAKWYEAEAIIRNHPNKDDLSLMVEVGLRQSEFIRDLLLTESKQAIESMENGTLSQSFTKVAEAIIILAGTVGGYAGRFGRIAGAHAIHNGLSQLDETHHILHGQKVAYGILVQLVLEDRMDDIEELLPFYQELELPTTFRELGITENIEDAMNIISSHAVKPEESLQLMGSYDKRDVIRSLEAMEHIHSEVNE